MSLAALGYSLFRCFSKNAAHDRESDAFLRITKKPHRTFAAKRQPQKNRKTALYPKFKNYGATLSAPRGKPI